MPYPDFTPEQIAKARQEREDSLVHYIFNAVYNNDANQLRQLLAERAELFRAARKQGNLTNDFMNHHSLNLLFIDDTLSHEYGYEKFSLLTVAILFGHRATLEFLFLHIIDIDSQVVEQNGKYKSAYDVVIEQSEATQIIFVKAALRKKRFDIVTHYLEKNKDGWFVVFSTAVNLLLFEDIEVSSTPVSKSLDEEYADIFNLILRLFSQHPEAMRQKILGMNQDEGMSLIIVAAKRYFPFAEMLIEQIALDENDLKFIVDVWKKSKNKDHKDNLRNLLLLVLPNMVLTNKFPKSDLNDLLMIVLNTKKFKSSDLSVIKKLTPLVDIDHLFYKSNLKNIGVSFFHLAAKLGKPNVIKELIACKPSLETFHATCDKKNINGTEAVMYSALQVGIASARTDLKALAVVTELMKSGINKGRGYAKKLAEKRGFTETANFLAAQIKTSKYRSNSESGPNETLKKYETALSLKSKSRTSSAADVAAAPVSQGSTLDVKEANRPKTEPVELYRSAAMRSASVSAAKAIPLNTIATGTYLHPAGLTFNQPRLSSPITIKSTDSVQAAIPLNANVTPKLNLIFS